METMSDRDFERYMRLCDRVANGSYPRPRCARCGKPVDGLHVEDARQPHSFDSSRDAIVVAGCHGEQEVRRFPVLALLELPEPAFPAAFEDVPPEHLCLATPWEGAQEDGHGRVRWTVTWMDPSGVFRSELGGDGQPVGHRRGQVFHVTVAQARRFLTSRPGNVTRLLWPMRLPRARPVQTSEA